MNRPTDHPPIDASLDDREFEAYLRRESQVSQQYRNLQDDEVPAHLGALVLEQARAALEKEEPAAAPRDDLAAVRRRRGRLMRWGVPTALAASALLVVSIVIRSGVQHETLLLPQVRQEAPAAAAQPAPVDDNVVATELVRESPPLAPAPAIVAAEEPAAKELRQPRADIQSAQKRRAAQESSAAAARATRPLAQVDAMAAPPPAMVAAPPRVAEPIETTSEQPPAPAPANAPLAKAAPVPVQADADGELDEIAVTGYRAAGNVRGAGPRDTIRTNTSYAAAKASTTTEAFQAPEPWLEHIRQLRRDGDDLQADREWRRFRKQYPDYVVAADDAAREHR